jgi:putative membrane protein
MAFESGLYRAGWFQAKFVLVLLLSGLHGFLSRCVREFTADANTRSPKFYRIINEIPAVLMVAIVLLAVLKPF